MRLKVVKFLDVHLKTVQSNRILVKSRIQLDLTNRILDKQVQDMHGFQLF